MPKSIKDPLVHCEALSVKTRIKFRMSLYKLLLWLACLLLLSISVVNSVYSSPKASPKPCIKRGKYARQVAQEKKNTISDASSDRANNQQGQKQKWSTKPAKITY